MSARHSLEAVAAVGRLAGLREMAGPILEADDPLVLVDQKIEELGYAGDRNPVVLVYAVVTWPSLRSRSTCTWKLSQAPAKAYTTDTALRLHPPRLLSIWMLQVLARSSLT